MPTRRMILLGGAAAGGALIVGYALWPSDRLERVASLAGGKNEQVITNWLKIGADDTVTVIVPHCDMGTGIFTALPQIAAEELDADWSKVRAEQAPADPVFANGALAEGFILSGRGWERNTVPAFLRGLTDRSFRTIADYMDLQVTGGSSAVRFTGVYCMRVTAAAAREMLVKAAAARWKVSPDACTVKNSRVIHGDKSFGFGELAAEAANYSPSDNPKVKSPERLYADRKIAAARRYSAQDQWHGAIRPRCEGRGDAIRSPAHCRRCSAASWPRSRPARSRRSAASRRVVKLDDAVVVVADRYWRAKDAVAAARAQMERWRQWQDQQRDADGKARIRAQGRQVRE